MRDRKKANLRSNHEHKSFILKLKTNETPGIRQNDQLTNGRFDMHGVNVWYIEF